MMRRRWLQMAAITGGILLVLAILYRHTIADLYTFWTDGTPQYSRAIPARAIVVLRCNVAKLALKGDLGTLSGHRQIAVLKEKIGRLYPRMDALFANPFEETGIQLANNQYLFVVPEPAGGAGILFGVRDRDKAAKFLTHLSEGMLPEKEGAYDLLRLSSGAAIGWNDAFGILFVRTNGERELTVAEWDALMNPTDSGSFMKDVEKSKVIESKHDITGYCVLEVFRPFVPKSVQGIDLPPFDSTWCLFTADFEKGILRSVFDVRTKEAGEVPGGLRDRYLLASLMSDTSLLTAAFHIPMKTALAAVKKNIPDPASRNNEAGISAIDVLTAFSGDVVLEVVDVQPGKDLRGRTWPFPQFGLCAGVANAAVMRIASEYLVTHNIARRTSDRYEIRFGDLELFFLLQHKSLYVSNTRRLIQRIPPLNLNLSPVNSADVLSRFSVRIGKILPAVSPFVPDQRAGDLMTIAGNSIDAVSENAQVEGKGKRVTIAISMKDKKRNSLASLADMVLQLVERYVQ